MNQQGEQEPQERSTLIPSQGYSIMNRYHWTLFWLCGSGWAIDNLVLQATTVILPFLKNEFNLQGPMIGIAATSLLVGMTIGGLFWGVFSDMFGRLIPFKATLIATSLFSLAASMAGDISVLVVMLSFVGFSVGGNLTNDGILFVESIPESCSSLLTLLSIFWPIGQLIIAIFAWAIVPAESCTACEQPVIRPWRQILLFVALISGSAAILRVCLISVHESPQYLAAILAESEICVQVQALDSVYSNGDDEPNCPDEVAFIPSATPIGPQLLLFLSGQVQLLAIRSSTAFILFSSRVITKKAYISVM